MEENREAMLCLMRTLNGWLTSRLNKAGFDRTLSGTVVQILSDGYTVNIAGQNHKIKSKTLTIPLRTQVRVKLPCNSWAQAYIESVI